MSQKRRKINSIHYGGKILSSGVGIEGLGLFLRGMVKNEFWNQVGSIVCICGIVILVGITLWLVIEGFQDRYWNQHDLAERNRKVKLGNGMFECQNCGNRKVRGKDLSCNICGCQFKER